MNADSQFESARIGNYKRDFYNDHYNWNEDAGIFWHPRTAKFDYTDSTETNESEDGFVFRVPLSEIDMASLKIVPADTYILVQSSKKTIFLTLAKEIMPDTITTAIKEGMLLISVKKFRQ